jgi:cytochrome c-type biogenesis protein CcmH/NrfF
MEPFVCQFIPILLIFVLLAYPKQSAKFCHSVLGKLVALSIIIFYSSLDKYVGLAVCILVIYYYQLDYVESMLNMDEITQDFAKATRLDKKETIKNKNIVDKFREENCENNQLHYKGTDVKQDMTQHVYPYVSYNKNECNPCLNTCDISIIETEYNKKENYVISTMA